MFKNIFKVMYIMMFMLGCSFTAVVQCAASNKMWHVFQCCLSYLLQCSERYVCVCACVRACVRACVILVTHGRVLPTNNFLTFRDHLHIFVGQSSPSFPVLSVFSHVSCQFIFVHIFPGVVDPSPSRPPLLLFPGTTMSISV